MINNDPFADDIEEEQIDQELVNLENLLNEVSLIDTAWDVLLIYVMHQTKVESNS